MPLVRSLRIGDPAAGIRLRTSVWTNPFRFPCFWSIQAAQNGRPQFEVDPDKAREALKKLDQELQSISQKPIPAPRKKARDPGLEDLQMREEMPEISGSFLGYTAGVLLLFTLFYNILFFTVIKPAIDLPSDSTARIGAPK